MYDARDEGGYLQIKIFTQKSQTDISQIFNQLKPQIHVFNKK